MVDISDRPFNTLLTDRGEPKGARLHPDRTIRTFSTFATTRPEQRGSEAPAFRSRVRQTDKKDKPPSARDCVWLESQRRRPHTLSAQ